MRKLITLSALLLFSPLLAFAQETNDKQLAQYRYGKVVFGDLTPKLMLPGDLKETSGLVFWQNSLWTHNDSGGEPVIYQVDTATAAVIRTVRLENAENRDWEDITHDQDHIYVGDFGNNSGNRRDLKIYKLKKSDIPEEGDATVSAEVIKFRFADQTSFENENREHNFDCEAIISFNDALYLFSKNWIDGKTRMYRIPSAPGDHIAEVVDSLDVDGLVTGADMNPSGDRLVLLGYRDFYPFLMLISGFEGNNFLQGKARKMDFPFEGGVQTEGIAFHDSTSLFISCEELKTEPQVFSYNLDKWEEMAGEGLAPSVLDNWDLTVVGKKKKGKREIAVDLTAMRGGVFYSGIETMMGKKVTFPGYTFDRHMGKNYLKIDTFPLDKGKYRVYIGNGSAKSEKEVILDDK